MTVLGTKTPKTMTTRSDGRGGRDEAVEYVLEIVDQHSLNQFQDRDLPGKVVLVLALVYRKDTPAFVATGSGTL